METDVSWHITDVITGYCEASITQTNYNTGEMLLLWLLNKIQIHIADFVKSYINNNY